MSQLKKITFFTVAGGEQTVNVQHYESKTDIEFWGENDRAVSGKIRHNLRGIRSRFRLSYDHSTEAATYRSILNNIMTDLAGGETEITISEGSDLTEAKSVVPTDEFMQRLEYVSQITGFMPAMEFVGAGKSSASTGGWVEVGWVNPGWVEQGV